MHLHPHDLAERRDSLTIVAVHAMRFESGVEAALAVYSPRATAPDVVPLQELTANTKSWVPPRQEQWVGSGVPPASDVRRD